MTTSNNQLPAARRDRGGFTLIELMVTVAIIALLAAIAIPNYSQYMVRSNRTAAKQFILTIASKQEQYILDARQYATGIFGSGAGNLNLVAPSETNRYDFTLAACAAPCTTYTITATPKAAFPAQVADGVLTLDNIGTKTGTWDK
jgi:type IV pilus assembly protein PilE